MKTIAAGLLAVTLAASADAPTVTMSIGEYHKITRDAFNCGYLRSALDMAGMIGDADSARIADAIGQYKSKCQEYDPGDVKDIGGSQPIDRSKAR